MKQADRRGCSERLFTKDAIAAVITNKANLRASTARRLAWSNSAAGDRLSIATFRSVGGWQDSVAVRTSAAFASAARCPDFLTSSCHLWTSRREQSFQRPPSVFTEPPFANSAA